MKKSMLPLAVEPPQAAREVYRRGLHDLRIQLVRLQNDVIRKGLRVLVVFEGRDAAGKDGAIKRITKHLSARETRVVALGRPSDRDRATWYFQRYVPHLPENGEIVLFNRSWYNRAGVERVMGFCTREEHELFLEDAPRFEHLLVRSGIHLYKIFLDITKAEQKHRLAHRSHDPLERSKESPIDAVAVKHWEAYSEARNEMLERTHTAFAPWVAVRTDDKRVARLSVIQAILAGFDYKGKDERLLGVDRNVVFQCGSKRAIHERLAP